jgi:hypothetical protein
MKILNRNERWSLFVAAAALLVMTYLILAQPTHAAPPNAPNGGTVMTVYHTSYPNPDGTGGADAQVECPRETVVVGGGFMGHKKLRVRFNNKQGNGWRVIAKPYSPIAQPLTAYARCLKSDTSSVTSFTASVTSTSTSPFYVYVPCPEGSVPVGGGYDMDNHLYHVDYSHARANGWFAQARLGVINPKTLTVTVICLADAGARVTYEWKSFTVPSHQKATDWAVCPAGAQVTGGGFRAFDLYWTVHNFPRTASRWQFTGINDFTPNAVQVRVQAVCLSY